MFKAEHYLDKHLESRHADQLPSNLTLCLADFCDLLACPSWVETLRQQPNALGRCRPRERDARRHFCQHLMHDCIPQGTARGDRLFDQLDAQLCGRVTCEWQEQLRDGAVLELRPSTGTATVYYLLAAIILAILGLVYTGVCCWYQETKAGYADLRPRRRRGYFIHKSKVY